MENYLGPIKSPIKFTAGFLSAGMKTLSHIFAVGGLKSLTNNQLKIVIMCYYFNG